MSIGSIIRTLREEKELSQRALAERVGVNRSMIICIENHTKSSFTILPKIAEILETDVATIYSMAEMQDPSQRRKRLQ